MGGVAKTVGRVGSGVFTLGGSEIARRALGRKNLITQALNAPGTILTGGMNGQDAMPSVFGERPQNPSIPGPFSLDPAQVIADKNAINQTGQQQYDATQQFIGSDAAARAQARDQLAKSLTEVAGNTFQRMLPGTLEDLNARHLLNGSGLGQELGRQQGYLAQDIANQIGQLGAQDISNVSAQKGAALQGLQGFQTGALQRGLSLEDFINQANVAKTIGAQMAPQAPSGKQNFGTVAQGVGALAPWANVGKAAKAAPAAAAMGPVGPMALAGATLLPHALSLLG